MENNLVYQGIESLHLNPKLADVIFQIKHQKIPAHRMILASCSSVFEAQFFGSMAEYGEIKINDDGINDDAFKEFLQFFYSKNVKLSMKNIKSVMYLCKKYQVDDCLRVCSEFLKKNLTINEMCLGYQLSLYFDQKDLKAFCQRKISKNTKKILKTEGFFHCDWIVLNEIINFDILSCRESDVLQAIMDWARFACERKKLNTNNKENIRNQLKDVIYDVRFNKISVIEFAEYLMMNPNNPYNSEDFCNIFPILAKKIVASTKFNLSHRSIPINF